MTNEPVRTKLVRLDDEGATFEDEGGMMRQWFARRIWEEMGRPLDLVTASTQESTEIKVIR